MKQEEKRPDLETFEGQSCEGIVDSTLQQIECPPSTKTSSLESDGVIQASGSVRPDPVYVFPCNDLLCLKLGRLSLKLGYPIPRPRDYRDIIRSRVTSTLLSIFGATILFSFVMLFARESVWTEVKDLLLILLPVETALIGAAVGFYFGARTANFESGTSSREH